MYYAILQNVIDKRLVQLEKATLEEINIELNVNLDKSRYILHSVICGHSLKTEVTLPGEVVASIEVFDEPGKVKYI